MYANIVIRKPYVGKLLRTVLIREGGITPPAYLTIINHTGMKRIVLKYNERNSLAKKTIDYILSLGVFEMEEKSPALDESLQEAKDGKINKYDSVDEFFRLFLNTGTHSDLFY